MLARMAVTGRDCTIDGSWLTGRARASTLGLRENPIGLTVRCMRTDLDDLFAQDSEMGSTKVSK